MERRELTTRNANWAHKTARILAKSGVSPNAISMFSMLFALLAGAMFYLSGVILNYRNWFLFLGIFGVQMRLLCNMLDGMVAVEFNKKSKNGDVFNDAPDRVSDILILIGVSLAIPNKLFSIHLGFVISILAVLTAYIRLLGGALSLKQSFKGPMAKQHRMAVVTGAVILDIVKSIWFTGSDLSFIYISLWVILIGSLITCYNRLKFILIEIELKE